MELLSDKELEEYIKDLVITDSISNLIDELVNNKDKKLIELVGDILTKLLPKLVDEYIQNGTRYKYIFDIAVDSQELGLKDIVYDTFSAVVRHGTKQDIKHAIGLYRNERIDELYYTSLEFDDILILFLNKADKTSISSMKNTIDAVLDFDRLVLFKYYVSYSSNINILMLVSVNYTTVEIWELLYDFNENNELELAIDVLQKMDYNLIKLIVKSPARSYVKIMNILAGKVYFNDLLIAYKNNRGTLTYRIWFEDIILNQI